LPELPEVETVARQLNAAIAGLRVKDLQVLDARLGMLPSELVESSKIACVKRYGKRVVLELIPPRRREPGVWLAVHLRMTGRLIWQAGQGAVEPARSLRAVLALNKGQLGFYDTRRFGTIDITDHKADILPPGLEPLDAAVTWQRLKALAGKSPTPLKAWLLRQDKLTGLGNIYASEACFAARLNPERPVGSLGDEDFKRLNRSIKRILRAAIKHCGTTFSDFQDSTGSVGGYVKYLKVYARAGQPCRTCGTPIEKLVQGQRSTFYCPECQQ
jgi:formamidopyrimidine-DNA glycosylase